MELNYIGPQIQMSLIVPPNLIYNFIEEDLDFHDDIATFNKPKFFIQYCEKTHFRLLTS